MKSQYYIAINSQGHEAPEWVHLIPAGEFCGRDGRGPWRLSDPEGFITATLDYQAGADILLDYEHQNELAPKNGQPAPAAAWIKELEAREDGIWGRADWTPKGRQSVISREYRYLSPVFTYDEQGNLLRLESAALANRPNLELKSLNSQGVNMDQFLMELAKALGLPEAATQEEIYAAILKLKEQGESANSEGGEDEDKKAENSDGPPETPPEDMGEAEANLLSAVSDLVTVAEETAEGKTTEGASAENKAKNQALMELSAKYSNLERCFLKAEAGRAVNAAINAGKISPSLREWGIAYAASDPKGFAGFIKSAPTILQPGQKAMNSAALGRSGLTAEEKSVCRQLNMSEADYLKARKGGN